jgi:hypothetical protein
MIRIAMIVGVACFGGLTWYLHATGRRPAQQAPTLDLATMVLWVAATAALLYLRRLYAAAPTRARRATAAILGWSAGELAALAGIVHYFVTGDPQRFTFGMLVFVIALLLFPIPRGD